MPRAFSGVAVRHDAYWHLSAYCRSIDYNCGRQYMKQPRLSRLELTIMEALWKLGASSVREIQESLPGKDRPAHTTVQTMLTRLETKGVVRRAKKISNAHIYEAVISRSAAQRRLV